MSLDPEELNIPLIAGPPVGVQKMLRAPSFNWKFWSQFLGVIVNWALFGVISIQVYLYNQAFPNDRPTLKTLVYGIYLLETAQMLLLTQTAWIWLISGFGNIEGFDSDGTTWMSICFIDGLVGLLVQCFYAYRIAILSQSRILPGLVTLLSLVSFGGALATTINQERIGIFSQLRGNGASLAFDVEGIWAGVSSGCDVLITACMCYYLRRYNESHEIFSRSQAIVSRLVRMTIETGALTASVCLLTLILYCAPSLRNAPYFEVPAAAQAKLYSTTMLAVLNSRMKIGLVSESATWREHELRFASVAPSRDTNAITINMSSTPGPFQSSNVFVTKEEPIIHMDEPKAQKALDTLSGAHANDSSV